VTEDLDLIVEAAREAGALILEYRARGLNVEYKENNSPVSDADLAADALLKTRLRAARPDYGWLSEETADDPERLDRRRIFLVDPIDGTRAYVKDKPWFSVCIAVVEDGAPVASVVLAPALGETYTALAGGGAFLNGEPIRPSVRTDLNDALMVSEEALFRHAVWANPWPPMRYQNRNSLAYRVCLVAAGAADAAISWGGKSDWDLGAADLIAREAGAAICDWRGDPYVYNRPDPSQLGLMAAAPGLAPLILERTRLIERLR
jgi:myo-inositol-1(or 4)-monophosphatase